MEHFEQYQIIKKIGEGTFGETFLAQDGDQKVVIKQLKVGELDRWKTLRRFHREARVLKQLNHPAIPAYIDFIETEHALGIVQSYIPGETLQQLIEHEKRFTIDQLEEILKQGLNILSYLQQKELIHRDLSPKNIILDPDGKLWFVDFGAVQRQLSDRNSTITTMGTFGYMAPEQILGKTTHQSDLFSFGMSMIALISGKPVDQLPQDLITGTLAEEVFENLPEPLQYTLKTLVEPGLDKRFKNGEAAQKSIGHSVVKSKQKNGNHLKAITHKALKIYQCDLWRAWIIDEDQPPEIPSTIPHSFYWPLIIHLIIVAILLNEYVRENLLRLLIYPAIIVAHYFLYKILKNRIKSPVTLSEQGYILYLSNEKLYLEYHQTPLWNIPRNHLKSIELIQTQAGLYFFEFITGGDLAKRFGHYLQTEEEARLLISELKEVFPDLEVIWNY